MPDGEAALGAGPADRSSTTQADIQNRTENRFVKRAKLLMRRNGKGLFEFEVTVADLEYNDARKGWDYKVKDGSTGIEYPGWIPERDLKAA